MALKMALSAYSARCWFSMPLSESQEPERFRLYRAVLFSGVEPASWSRSTCSNKLKQ